ncbi:SWI/SNF complex component SNF12-like protein [Hibiscus syriacus]|uniref:SWI/SNF complex component SNF12-like protein n=1 Tax=Hibiscus syriacus TaxID=106335 RepID=A0A6A3ARX3_HIBSY|nr:SWI/SNF complex component SNF12 homolog [Hibiscus syriacus]KAE8707471.1 SWI/SNF complex component SNF12-like protein [Hibiscus syriacus]
MNNNSNIPKTFGAPSQFGNSGTVAKPQSIPINNQPHPVQGGPQFPGHFQFSEPQAQVLARAQYAQAHAQPQVQPHVAAHSQFPAQVHSQNASNSNAASIPSPLVTTPGSGSVKRSSQKPPSKNSGSSNSSMASLFKTTELTPAAPRKKQKLPERQIPDKVAAILPECALYTQFLEFEAKVDAALSRKKADIQQSLKNPSCIQKTLRIYVFNTCSDQGTTDPDQKSTEAPSWSLKIIGRILEDGKDPVLAGKVQKSYPKFSSFFKKITIYLDASLYPDNHVILWESARSPALHEGFEMKRKGDKESTVRIRIEMNYCPERFKLSPVLTELLGIEVDTRPRILAAIWHYVKSKNLQNYEDSSTFSCDPPLQKVFGEEKMKFIMVSQKISQYLTPLSPIHLEHRIKLSGNCPIGSSCYDVQVDVPLPLEMEKSAFLADMEKNKEIDACDEVICTAIKKMHEHCRRRAFFLGFSQSPAEFITSLISSQGKDLELFAGEANHNAEKERRSEFYNQPWIEDAVIRYLNRKSIGGDSIGST